MCMVDVQAGENASGYHDNLDVPWMAIHRYVRRDCPIPCRVQSLTSCRRCGLLDMGGPNAAHPVSVGVEGILKVVASLTPEKSGQFVNFKGEHVPWGW